MDKDEQAQEEAKEIKVKAAPEPAIPVKVIGQKDGSALVEWQDGDGMYHRAYVPQEKVAGGAVEPKVLEKGIPYGLPWEEWIEVTATPAHVANELRRMGVWCKADLNHAALNAVNKGFDQGALLRRVQQEASQ
jgi:hypothetical protein